MSRLKLRSSLVLLTLASSISCSVCSLGPEADWDVSPADRSDYYPSNHLAWTRFDDSPFVTRAIGRSNRQRARAPVKRSAVDVAGGDLDRRDAPDASLEQIAMSKNVREARMQGSPETWSKQPLAVQFRNRPAGLEQMAPDRFADDSDEATANLPPMIRAHYAPKTDFVTSGRARAIPGLEGTRLPPPEERESRDIPIARSYDDYDVPIFRNIVREHDFDVQIPRNYYYPNRYRSQRDFYYRGAGGAGNQSPYTSYDGYRDEDEDYEAYERYRPSRKPKRIIYYATLPEVVRKPVDLRNYPRPYDPLIRGPEAQINAERNRLTPNNIEPSRRPLLRYPYDNYDNYVKRSSYYDRRRPPYAAGEDRLRDQERNRASYKEKLQRSDDRKLENQIARLGDDRRIPWPVQIGTEVSVKDNERIPGRKIFGQIDGYERYEGSRIKKTSGNAERKEDINEDSASGSNINSDNKNN